MKRFIIWLKRILFRNKYKRNLINELKPGDLFWGYLYEFKGNKIPKGHNLRSFMFVKFEGDIIHCLFTTSKKNNDYIRFNSKNKDIYLDSGKILLLNYKKFKNKSNYKVDPNTLDIIIYELMKKYKFSEYKDLYLESRTWLKRWSTVSTLGMKLVVLECKNDKFVGCILYKQPGEGRYKLSNKKYVDCALCEIEYGSIIQAGKSLNSSEIMLMEAYLTVCKKKVKKNDSIRYSTIGDELIISDEIYTVIDVYQGYYFVASLRESGYHKIKAHPFKAARKSSKRIVNYLSEKTMYTSKTLFNEYMPVRKYTINHDGTISWI